MRREDFKPACRKGNTVYGQPRKGLAIENHQKNLLYTATIIAPNDVIPAKAGIQEMTGFRVKPGMTNCIGLMSSCIDKAEGIPIFKNIKTKPMDNCEATAADGTNFAGSASL